MQSDYDGNYLKWKWVQKAKEGVSSRVTRNKNKIEIVWDKTEVMNTDGSIVEIYLQIITICQRVELSLC